MGRDRNSQGRYADGIDPETVLDVFDAREDTSRPLTAGDVVDALGIARRTAHNKLNRLVDRGVLDTRKIGARGRVWWTPTPAGDESGRETGETTSGATDDPHTGRSTDGRASPEYAAEETDAPDPIGDALDGWDPDTETAVEAARTQTRRAAEWLRSTGDRHTKSDFQAALADDSALTPRIWWERAVQPGLRRLAEDDLVEYRSGYHDYRWIGPDTDA